MSRIDDLIAKYCPNGVEYKELCRVLDYEQPSKYLVQSTNYTNDTNLTPVLTAGQTFLLGYTDENVGIYKASQDNPVIIFDDFTTANRWVDFSFKVKSSAIKLLKPKGNDNLKYVYYVMNSIKYSTQEHSRQWISKYSKILIPVPPLPVQQEIVRILDSFSELEKELEKELETREKQYEYYRNQLLSFGEGDECAQGVEIVKLGKYVEIQNGFAFKSALFKDNGIPILRITNIQQSGVNADNLIYVDVADYKTNFEPFKVFPGDIVVALSGATTGKTGKNKTQITFLLNQRVAKFVPDETHILKSYLYHWAKLKENEFWCLAGGGAQPNLSTEQMKKMEIVIPSIPQQERIVAILDKFDALVNDISVGLPAEIDARRKQYEYYREKLLTFPMVGCDA